MAQIILLVLGIFYVFKRPKLKRLTGAEFPGVPSSGFEEWRKLELASIDIFLWATWGLAVIGTIVAFALASMLAQSGEAVIVCYCLIFLSGLILSAIKGSKAAKLRKSLGIQWPLK